MPESTALRAHARGVPAPDSVRQGVLGIPGLRLHHGGRLERAEVAWRIVGPSGAPVVAALGGISADRTACDSHAPGLGWWRLLAGPGLPLDTSRFAVLGIDYLGGPGASTAPSPGQKDFPAIDTRDQAAALASVCDSLGIGRLHAVAGASYGGMVGLALAELSPGRVRRVLAISAAHRSNALATGWRCIQRAIVRHSLDLGDGAGGLALARALAMTTYRTRAGLEQRFPSDANAGAPPVPFEVERYLLARGAAYAKRTRPESFLCLSESIDRHRVDPARIRVPVTVVAIEQDQLVSQEEVRELAQLLQGPVDLRVLRSDYGHDAFLKERDLLAPAFRSALEGEET